MTRVAAIDCGTNSTRLLVADPGAPLTAVDRRMEVTRLGAGVDRRGALDDAALARTVERIGAYHADAVDAGAARVRIAATSAIRDAADRQRFLDAVADRTGVAAEVLTAEEEAATAFAGSVGAVDGPPPHLVLDVGGGSTELIVGEAHPWASTSRQMGCVRLTERCLPSDPPTAAELADADAVATAEMRAAVADLGLDDASARRPATVVGVAGTVTTLAALHLGLDAYDPGRIHASRLPAAAVDRLVGELAAMAAAQRAALGPMAPGREDVIVGGAVVVRAALRALRADQLLVSEADILDGLALSLLDGR